MSTARARRKRRWGARGQVALLAVFVAGGAWMMAHIAARDAESAVRDYSRRLAIQTQRDSVRRSVDTCRRLNPSRAYMQLRAREMYTGTATHARQVFSILDCQESVERHAAIPLPASAQDAYLTMFRRDRVPILRNRHIVGSVPFRVYFSHNPPAHP